jgi:hypothetical protein
MMMFPLNTSLLLMRVRARDAMSYTYRRKICMEIVIFATPVRLNTLILEFSKRSTMTWNLRKVGITSNLD